MPLVLSHRKLTVLFILVLHVNNWTRTAKQRRMQYVFKRSQARNQFCASPNTMEFSRELVDCTVTTAFQTEHIVVLQSCFAELSSKIYVTHYKF